MLDGRHWPIAPCAVYVEGGSREAVQVVVAGRLRVGRDVVDPSGALTTRSPIGSVVARVAVDERAGRGRFREKVSSPETRTDRLGTRCARRRIDSRVAKRARRRLADRSLWDSRRQRSAVRMPR